MFPKTLHAPHAFQQVVNGKWKPLKNLYKHTEILGGIHKLCLTFLVLSKASSTTSK